MRGYQEHHQHDDRMKRERILQAMPLEEFCGQCDKQNGKLLVLLHFTAHLADHQMHWQSYEQEL